MSYTQPRRSDFWAAFIGAAGGMAYGYPAGVIAGITGEPHWSTYSSGALGFLATSIVIGMAVGSTVAAYLTDLFGRKRVAIVSSFLTTVFGIVTGFVFNLWGLSVIRILQGLFVGGISSVAPPYVSELATDKNRKQLVTIYQLAVIGGMVISRAMNIWFDYVDDGWQYEFSFAAFFSFAMFIGCIFIPESPSWITKHQKKDTESVSQPAEESSEAPKEDSSESPKEESSEAQKEESSETPKQESSEPAQKPTEQITMKERFAELGKEKKQLIVALVLAVNLQMTGVNAVGSFAPATLSAAGLEDRMDQLVVSLALIVWDLFAVMSSLWSIRKFDSRLLLNIGSVITVVGLAMITIDYLAAPDDFDDSDNSRTVSVTLAIIGIAIFLFGFQFGVAPTYYVLITELFTDTVRGIGVPAAMAVCWLCNILVVQIYLPLIDGIGQGPTFIIFLAFAVLSVFFNIFVVRTTFSVDHKA